MELNVNLSRKKIAKIPLSQECKSIILGSILGDGSLKLTGNYANARLTIKHTTPQRDYMEWLVPKLKEIASEKSYVEQKPSGFSKNPKLVFQSAALPQLTEIWNLTGQNNLTIERNWLNHMTAISLAVWWFDDGSITAGYRQGVICTDNFLVDYCFILAKYLKVVWGVECRVNKKKKPKPSHAEDLKEDLIRKNFDYRLFLNNTSIKKLLCHILPYAVTATTVKKCLLVYKDIKFQQRWISQMKFLLPQESIAILKEILKSHNKIRFETLDFDGIVAEDAFNLGDESMESESSKDDVI